jgi:uncharacterized protein (DUF302 family)
MADYARTIVLNCGVDAAVERVEAALAARGFGILTEIDVAATLRAKLGVDVPEQRILGACNPALAYEALEIEPSIGLLLPCTVTVRAVAGGRTVVAALDPAIMITVTGNPALKPLADRAAERLADALDTLAA